MKVHHYTPTRWPIHLTLGQYKTGRPLVMGSSEFQSPFYAWTNTSLEICRLGFLDEFLTSHLCGHQREKKNVLEKETEMY